MNTKSGIFTSGEATRKKYCFCCSFAEIKIDLTLKKSNILYIDVILERENGELGSCYAFTGLERFSQENAPK